jgi:hypothetical protein
LFGSPAAAQMTTPSDITPPPHTPPPPDTAPAPSKFRSPDDGWLDLSGFLDEKSEALRQPARGADHALPGERGRVDRNRASLAILAALQRGRLRRLRRGVERLPALQRHHDGPDRRVGLRYEIARKYGIHLGLDVAFGPDNTAVYVQVGSAWARP